MKILLLLFVLGCFICSIIFIILAIPFLLPVFATRKIGEIKDGISWEEQNKIIKEKHNESHYV